MGGRVEDLHLGELATALFYLAVGLRLGRLAARSGGVPERLLGGLFLVTGSSYVLYWIPEPAPQTALAFAGRLLYLPAPVLLAVFTRRVFRPDDAWAGWLVHVTMALLVGGVTGSALAGDLEGFTLGNPWFWLEWLGYTLPFAWAGAEALRYHGRALRQQRLGLCEPLVCNRFLLWSLFGALQVTASLALLGQYASWEREGAFSAGWDWAMGAIEGGSLVPIWLAFFPPARYRRWIGRTRLAPAPG